MARGLPRCKRCKEPIEWATNANTGRKVAVEIVADNEGRAVRDALNWDGSHIVTVYPNREMAMSSRGIGVELYTVHFDRCR